MYPSSHVSLLHCLKPPLTAIDSYWEGQNVMGRSGHALGILSLGSPKDLRHLFFLACPRRLLWKRGIKWRSLICSPLLPKFNITSGHSHFCVHTSPTTPLSRDYWGGKTQRLYTNKCGHTSSHLLNWRILSWADCFCCFCFNQLPLTFLCPPQSINFEDRKKGDV